MQYCATDMQIWSDIQKSFKNEWVAMVQWEEDSYGDVSQGEVIYHSANRKEFYDTVKSQYANKDLAIRYTGDVEGPFLLAV